MDDRLSEYERWVRPIEDRMMRAVWRILRDPDDADDALQQALEKIWRDWSRIRLHPNPPALIMTIGINCAYDLVRKRSRRAGREFPDLDLDRHASHQPGADQLAYDRETGVMIRDAIGTLPPMQRSTVSLRLFADLSHAAIAQALGCTEATVRTHYMRALQSLRSRLAPLNPAGKEVQS